MKANESYEGARFTATRRDATRSRVYLLSFSNAHLRTAAVFAIQTRTSDRLPRRQVETESYVEEKRKERKRNEGEGEGGGERREERWSSRAEPTGCERRADGAERVGLHKS